MKHIGSIIILTTLYLVFYTITPFVDSIPERITLVMGLCGPFLVIYMVIQILRKGEPSNRTFEDGYWYDDKGKMTGD